jgi:hypothetical protein
MKQKFAIKVRELANGWIRGSALIVSPDQPNAFLPIDMKKEDYNAMLRHMALTGVEWKIVDNFYEQSTYDFLGLGEKTTLSVTVE